jgi:hypothetical protein
VIVAIVLAALAASWVFPGASRQENA